MKPAALVFDFFGVIAQFDDNVLYRRLVPHCPQPEAALAWLDDFASMPDLIIGRLSLGDVHRLLQQEIGLELTMRRFEEVWREPYSSPMPGMAPLLRELAHGYPLAVLSNIDRDYWRAIEPMHPELSLFTAVVLSFEQGICKPDPDIFEYACRRLDVPPEAAFFTDDRQKFVDAARAAGLDAHRFVSVPDLQDALALRGITTP